MHGAGGVTPSETSHGLNVGLILGHEARLELGGAALALLLCFPAAKQITVTPTAAFNQLLQLVNFTQRPKEQITVRRNADSFS